MTTLAEFMIVTGADNHPPMLEKSMYGFWSSHLELYTKNKENGRMILNSVKNGPLIWPTVEENGVTRMKKYEELSVVEKLQADCDLKATNIVLQGLPPDVYALVTHHKVAKEIWDRVKLLMQGTTLSRQEQECKLYDEFDKFTYVKGESLYHHPTPSVPQKACLTTPSTQQPLAEFPQLESGLATPVFLPGDDLIACLNKAMAFMSTGEGRMARQCTQPKRPRNSTWFKEKMLLVEAQELGQVLDEEQLAFLADPRMPDGQAIQTTIPHNAAFQTDDLDAYDSYCNDLSSAKAVLMANLSSYGSDVLSEITSDSNIIPYSQYLHETQNAVVQDSNSSAQQDYVIISMFEQMSNHVTNWDKANKENKSVNESLTAEFERYKERVKMFEQRLDVELSRRKKLIDSQMDDMIQEKNEKFAAFEQEIDTLKQTLSKHVKEKESLLTTFTIFKKETK
ncbi:hypothetical protein Tco_1237641 [Tanacetum coccineum]